MTRQEQDQLRSCAMDLEMLELAQARYIAHAAEGLTAIGEILHDNAYFDHINLKHDQRDRLYGAVESLGELITKEVSTIRSTLEETRAELAALSNREPRLAQQGGRQGEP